jgi:hypothetical protein
VTGGTRIFGGREKMSLPFFNQYAFDIEWYAAYYASPAKVLRVRIK